MDLKRGDIIFNSEQTEAILRGGSTGTFKRLREMGLRKVETLNIGGKSFSLGTDNEFFMKLFENIQNNPIPINYNTPTVPTDYSKYFNDNRKTTATELHFHGDLSFPNIHSGDDAQKLIADLKTIGTKALQRANKR